MHSAEKFNLTNQLAAWATAWIEIDEAEALASIEEHYLGNPDRKPEELQAILAALSVHGTDGHTHLRDQIVDGYQNLLENHSATATAPQIVADLTKWERWELADAIGEVLNSSDVDLQTSLELRGYVQQAAATNSGSPGASAADSANSSDVSRALWIVAGGCLILLPVWLVMRGGGGAR